MGPPRRYLVSGTRGWRRGSGCIWLQPRQRPLLLDVVVAGIDLLLGGVDDSGAGVFQAQALVYQRLGVRLGVAIAPSLARVAGAEPDDQLRGGGVAKSSPAPAVDR